MNAEQSAFSRMRKLYARISSAAPKERLYRHLKSSEAFDLIAAMEPRERPEAEASEGPKHIQTKAS